MTFATPWIALVAAAVAIPLMILLYVLKLRRATLRISSTLLWRSSFEDLEANVPFRRLRFSALLVLQLLILLALLFAAAEPQIRGQTDASDRVIILIDRSASMNANDGRGGSTRLDDAKATATDIIDRLGQRGGPERAMVIAFGASARVISGFESHRPTLRDAVASIEPTDERAQLDAALSLASAFATRRESDSDRPPDVVLISDGGVVPPSRGSFDLQAGVFRFVRVGPAADASFDNVGIVSFSARRDDEDPARLYLFIRLINAGGEPHNVVLRFLHEGEAIALREIEVPGRTDAAPGEASFTEAIDLAPGVSGVFAARHSRADALAADDGAALVLDPPALPRIIVAHPPAVETDPFLLDLLDVMQPQSVRVLTYDPSSPPDVNGMNADLIVFDRVSGHRLPSRPSITIGGVPAGFEVIEPGQPGGQRIVSWQRRHPMMRHVGLDDVLFAGFGGLVPPPGTTVLASGGEGAVIATLRARGAMHVLIGFELQKSNWPLQPSCLVFLRNAMDVLSGTESARSGRIIAPGATFTLRAGSGVESITLRGPREVQASVRDGSAAIGPLRRVGVYSVEGAAETDAVAVSLLSVVESDIATRDEMRVNAEVSPADLVQRLAPRELWPWLATLAVALLIVEWLWYLRRAGRRVRLRGVQ